MNDQLTSPPAPVAATLGLQDILRNLFTSLQVTLTDQYGPGEFVHLQSGEEGEVIDLTWRETRLRTPTGDIAVVPSSVIGNTVVTNYSRGDELYVLAVEFKVVADADLDRVVCVAVEAARAAAGASAKVEASLPPTCDVVSLAGAGATCVTRLGTKHYRQRRHPDGRAHSAGARPLQARLDHQVRLQQRDSRPHHRRQHSHHPGPARRPHGLQQRVLEQGGQDGGPCPAP
jgi:hypothetical protein